MKKLTIWVYDARQLPHSAKSTKNNEVDIIDPYVVVEMAGAEKDVKSERTGVTCAIPSPQERSPSATLTGLALRR